MTNWTDQWLERKDTTQRHEIVPFKIRDINAKKVQRKNSTRCFINTPQMLGYTIH